MKSTKTTKILYWVTTILIFLFEGVMPALTSHTDLAKDGIAHLGYPEYFLPMLTVFKVLGALALIIPQVPVRAKEWAYAGFTFTMLAAFVSHTSVDGFSGQSAFPLVVLVVLLLSYKSFHDLHKKNV